MAVDTELANKIVKLYSEVIGFNTPQFVGSGSSKIYTLNSPKTFSGKLAYSPGLWGQRGIFSIRVEPIFLGGGDAPVEIYCSGTINGADISTLGTNLHIAYDNTGETTMNGEQNTRDHRPMYWGIVYEMPTGTSTAPNYSITVTPVSLRPGLVNIEKVYGD